ncbi:MAG: hypothetical protein GVY06_07480 [Alphaproteobacteria bacterium]|jgi:hypothetical protein|nr:hypothetical protein [Alphaproteobacteria bacterium]
MTTPSESQARLVALVEAWGADPKAWPEAERTQAALAGLADPGPSLRTALAEARTLDESLAAIPAMDPPEGLAERVLAEAPAARRPAARWLASALEALFPDGRLWPAGAALASLAIGLVIGWQLDGPSGTLETDDDVIYAALGLQALETGMTGQIR